MDGEEHVGVTDRDSLHDLPESVREHRRLRLIERAVEVQRAGDPLRAAEEHEGDEAASAFRPPASASAAKGIVFGLAGVIVLSIVTPYTFLYLQASGLAETYLPTGVFLAFLLMLVLALAAKSQSFSVHRDVNVLRIHPRDFGFHDNLFSRF